VGYIALTLIPHEKMYVDVVSNLIFRWGALSVVQPTLSGNIRDGQFKILKAGMRT
jgi:hypothetical protein